jgi:hypothetical protein
MTKGISIDQHIKAEIITKIHDEVMRIVDAASIYRIFTKSIYVWLRYGVVNSSASLILENNHPMKENE